MKKITRAQEKERETGLDYLVLMKHAKREEASWPPCGEKVILQIWNVFILCAGSVPSSKARLKSSVRCPHPLPAPNCGLMFRCRERPRGHGIRLGLNCSLFTWPCTSAGCLLSPSFTFSICQWAKQFQSPKWGLTEMNEKTSHMYLVRTKPLKHAMTEMKPEQASPFLVKGLQIHTQCNNEDY